MDDQPDAIEAILGLLKKQETWTYNLLTKALAQTARTTVLQREIVESLAILHQQRGSEAKIHQHLEQECQKELHRILTRIEDKNPPLSAKLQKIVNEATGTNPETGERGSFEGWIP